MSAIGKNEKAIQLIKFDPIPNSEKTTAKINNKAITTVLEACGKLPICPICICGPARQGKSFLLGHMIRCLTEFEKGQREWMKSYDDSAHLTGFSFANGDQPVTQGIWLWSRPFIIPRKDGSKVAVLLIDTQGTNDEYTTQKDMTTIVGLSLLLSSMMTFNIFTKLMENTLAEFDTYIQYGLLVTKNVGKNLKPFQKLTFLFRDFNNPGQYPYGDVGGMNYLSTQLAVKERQPEAVKQVRKSIKQCFETMDCYLMPHIGNKALQLSFKGAMSELSPDFADHLKKFILNYLNPENLVVKTVLGTAVTGMELAEYLRKYVGTFNSDETPSPVSMWEATCELGAKHHIDKALEVYLTSIANVVKNGYIPVSVFEKHHKQAKSMADNAFRNAKKFGTDKQQSEYAKRLTQLIEKEKSTQLIRVQDVATKYINDAKSDANGMFRKKINNQFPFEDSNQVGGVKPYFEQNEIERYCSGFKNECLLDFKKKVESEENILQLVSDVSKIFDKIIKEYVTKNEANQGAALLTATRLKNELKQSHFNETKVLMDRNKLEGISTIKSYHQELVRKTVKKFQSGLNVKNGPNQLANQWVKELEKDLNVHFASQIQILEKQRKIAAQNASAWLNDCKASYKSLMENATYTTSAELSNQHYKSKIAAVRLLIQKVMADNEDHCINVKTLETQLAPEIEEMYRTIRTTFESKRREFDRVLTDANKTYRTEMKSFIDNHKYIRTATLRSEHSNMCSLLITKIVGANNNLGKDNIDEIKKSFNDIFLDFEKKNYTKLSSNLCKSIGIDLGTTNCCVAVVKDNEVIIVPSYEYGMSNLIPSYVAWETGSTATSFVYGHEAKSQAMKNLEDTVYEIKRIIGKPMKDSNVQRYVKFWPFTVVEGRKGEPLIEIGRERDQYRPQDISARLLRKLRKSVEYQFDLADLTIREAIITVPAYFDNNQREATVEAGMLAGFEHIEIISEPVAAAFAYQMHKNNRSIKKVLVFDLGGGTFDVAVIDVQNGINVISVDGDGDLGGEDFTKNLMMYCVKQFDIKFRTNIMSQKESNNKKTRDKASLRLRRLQEQCEKAKLLLSNRDSTVIVALAFYEEIDLEVYITRKMFEDMNMVEFEKTIQIVDATLKAKQLRKECIDEVLMIGGSTKIPKIRELLRSYFNGKVLNTTINADEAVAYGAAIRAAILKGHSFSVPSDCLTYKDVLPMTIGLRDSHMQMVNFLPRNTKAPTAVEKVMVTSYDYQTIVSFEIFQGENEVAEENRFLGQFIVDGVPKAPAGQEKFDVTFEIDRNGILHVTAASKSCSSNRGKITITKEGQQISKVDTDARRRQF